MLFFTLLYCRDTMKTVDVNLTSMKQEIFRGATLSIICSG